MGNGEPGKSSMRGDHSRKAFQSYHAITGKRYAKNA